MSLPNKSATRPASPLVRVSVAEAQKRAGMNRVH